MKNILIFGASKNLGLYLSKSISKKHNVYNFSRTQLNKNSFKVDIRDINSIFGIVIVLLTLSLLIYIQLYYNL